MKDSEFQNDDIIPGQVSVEHNHRSNFIYERKQSESITLVSGEKHKRSTKETLSWVEIPNSLIAQTKKSIKPVSDLPDGSTKGNFWSRLRPVLKYISEIFVVIVIKLAVSQLDH